jgi:hypothetical protein
MAWLLRDVIAPVLSRYVWAGCADGLPAFKSFGFAATVDGSQTNATAQNRRARIEDRKASWARRVFRPTDRGCVAPFASAIGYRLLAIRQRA